MPESSYSKHFWIHPMTMKNPPQRCGLSRKENQIPPNTRKQIWLVKSLFPDLFLVSKRFLQILKFDARVLFSFPFADSSQEKSSTEAESLTKQSDSIQSEDAANLVSKS